MECIFSNQRSEQSWASKEHLEWMENILCNYCHPFNQCEMIKSYKDSGFWLKSFSLNRGCNLLTLSQLGANLKSQSGRGLFRNNGRQDTLGPKAGVSLTSRSVNFPSVIRSVLEFLADSWLCVCGVGRCWQTWRVAYQSSRTFWWPFFLERRTDLHIISFPLYILLFSKYLLEVSRVPNTRAGRHERRASEVSSFTDLIVRGGGKKVKTWTTRCSVTTVAAGQFWSTQLGHLALQESSEEWEIVGLRQPTMANRIAAIWPC